MPTQRTSEQLETRVLSSLAEIDANAAAWRDLERRCAGELTFFQTLSWCRAWVAQFQGARVQPRIRTVWSDGRMVAVWPLMLTTATLGIQKLETLGDPHSQYANMICEPEIDAHAVAAALVDGLAKGSACDLAVLNAVPGGSRLGQALALGRSTAARSDEASILDLSSFTSSQHYSASIGKVQRRSRSRRRTQLARQGEIGFKVLWPGDSDYRSTLATCMAMKRRWLKETSRYSAGFALKGYEEFLATLEGDAATLSGACLSVLSVGGRVAAIELGFLRNRHYYSYIGSYDWDLREHSPGKVQMEMTVCWLIDQGVRAFDLMGNSADYKASWSNRSEPLSAHTIAFSWRGRIYAGAWVNGLRPAGKRIFNAFPESVRRLAVAKQTFGLLGICFCVALEEAV